MIPLAQLSRSARLTVRLLWVVGIGGLATFALAAAFDLGDTRGSGLQILYVCLPLVPAALCILRAALVAEERAVWAIFGAGMVLFAAGYAYYFVAIQPLESVPYPSLSDALWLCYTGGSLVALMLLMSARLQGFRRSLWIDAAVGGLALAALSAALLIDPILASTGGDLAAVATNSAYPLAGLLIVSVLLGVFALSGWRPGRGWILLGGAFAFQAVFDTVYLYQAASGTYQTGGVLDLVWPVAMLMVALAAWHRPEPTTGGELLGWPALAITSGFAVVGLFLTTYDHWYPVNDVAAVLASLTLIAAFVRTAMTFGDMKTLSRGGKELSLRNESILRAAGEGIYGIDRDGMVTFANPAATRMTGHEPEDLLGHRQHELIHHTKPDGTPYPAAECPVWASLDDGTVHHSAEDVYWRKDGSSFPVEYTSTPILEGDRVTGAVVVFKDITDRREVERAKDEFTSVVSHELRTPLTSIRGSLGLLESGVLGPLPEQGQRMVEIAVENTDRLVRLINDILDIERIDAGKIDMNPVPCEAAELIEQAVAELRPVALEGHVGLEVAGEPVSLFADPDRVHQTLTNLISNAVKFSEPGATVRVSSERCEGEVLFRVSDEGRGIPAEKLDSIFERFQQVDASDSREKGGTGLGLAICRTIVEHHGGRIWAESVLGQGASFSFVLPAQAAGASAHGQDGGEGPAVLLCDDDPAVVEVVGTLLAQRGYRVIEAGSGAQALERAISERPDAILLDLLMPGMSGWETAAALKQRPETSEIPIVILSVLSQAEAEAPSVPVVDWVEKPLDEAALFQALERAVNPRSEPFKVLVVEDDPDLAAILTATFEHHGVKTFHAATGLEAIELSQQVMPDLLVLDIGLPEADGFEVVDWLRRHQRLSALPVVVYTAKDLDETDRQRLRLGETTEFLAKGRITPKDFEQRVMGLLAHLTQDPTPETGNEPEAHLVSR